ncbi:hypothetical protein L596_006259 [Steinernema carpocapsae]|uniref:Uncharacterized protein n=1 Tax=Steinernema carpocapsae TaxID=34508 RepID=A0A4U8V1L8_STECR|nr:hypothetical protein L596_006259 [Steinernema carpocapsae]
MLLADGYKLRIAEDQKPKKDFQLPFPDRSFCTTKRTPEIEKRSSLHTKSVTKTYLSFGQTSHGANLHSAEITKQHFGILKFEKFAI